MTGLESNGYYINNEIWITDFFYNQFSESYIILRIQNQTENTENSFRIYRRPDGNARVNLSPILKAMFGKANANVFKISTLFRGLTQESIIKTFIRGGERTTKTNINASSSTWLNPSVKFPYFPGLPITYDFLNANYEIEQLQPEASLIVNRNVKGCNGLYFKFLNQKGGYSYWYFESHSFTESSSNLGGFIQNNQNNDLGNEVITTLKAYSKFPEMFKEIAMDLIVSNEIYLYQNGEFVRIRNAKNSFEFDEIKKAYAVNLKFDINYRFNPSSIWSN